MIKNIKLILKNNLTKIKQKYYLITKKLTHKCYMCEKTEIKLKCV